MFAERIMLASKGFSVLGFRADKSEYVSMGCSRGRAPESEAKWPRPVTTAGSYTKTGQESLIHPSCPAIHFLLDHQAMGAVRYDSEKQEASYVVPTSQTSKNLGN